MHETMSANTLLTRTDCSSCGIIFAVPTQFIEMRRTDGVTFFCPNGHHLSWKTSVDAQKAAQQKELTEAKAVSTKLTAELKKMREDKAAADAFAAQRLKEVEEELASIKTNHKDSTTTSLTGKELQDEVLMMLTEGKQLYEIRLALGIHSNRLNAIVGALRQHKRWPIVLAVQDEEKHENTTHD